MSAPAGPSQNMTDLAMIQQFFHTLYPDVGDGYLVLSSPGQRGLRSVWVNLATSSLADVAKVAAERNTKSGGILWRRCAAPRQQAAADPPQHQCPAPMWSLGCGSTLIWPTAPQGQRPAPDRRRGPHLSTVVPGPTQSHCA